jgi:DNA polymerase (family 10)
MQKSMDRQAIITALEEMALWLELKGENPFKIRAYQNGIRAMETLTEDLDTLIQSNMLDQVPGIGKTLAEKIAELRRTGKSVLLEELRQQFPATLLDLFELSGLGAKKIKVLYEKLSIQNLQDLKRACEQQQVSTLPGFGSKTEEKILQAIARREENSKRHLWVDAEPVVESQLRLLRALPQVERAEVAGSFRRHLETVGDLDFIVAASDSQPIMEAFCQQPDVIEVLAQGPTKSSVRLTGGLQADLRVVPAEIFGYALHHFTGSKEHNVQMRQRALSMNYSLSEWGLFAATDKKSEGGKPVRVARSEDDLFDALRLAPIPPELREGQGEIEAAAQGKLPVPLQLSDLTGTFHNHTHASDGRHSLEEMCKAAARMGWDYFGIADHSQASFQANGLSPERLYEQIQQIRNYNESGKAPLTVLSGVECDILKDGSLDYGGDRDLLGELDYVVASLHISLTQDEETMTARIIRAIEHPEVNILGHLTARLLLNRPGISVKVEKILDAAVANQVAIELNTNPHRLDMDWRFWKNAINKGVVCAINPDAHDIEGISHISYGIPIARKGWIEKEHVLNCHSLQDVRKFFAKSL